MNITGHEDLRQDERAMQLFGLVNTLLSQDPDSFKRALHIQRYPIIPLAPNVGLMGWVQQTETLHVLIRDYRGRHRIQDHSSSDFNISLRDSQDSLEH
jgi:FKBP12-rapamycin complex-associated protein